MTPIDMRNSVTDDAIRQIQEAAAAKKCSTCGCFHSSLKAIQETLQGGYPQDLQAAIEAGEDTLQAVQYDCLGCEVCYPALAVNALGIEAACPTEEAVVREGWPPLPGDYTVWRYRSPVAVCTLTDRELADRVAPHQEMNVAIAGTMQTENLGIERVVLNILGNPNIRFLIVCGPDSRKTIGHLPGQSLTALAHNGLDDSGRIIGARGKRPLLRNVPRNAVEHFRRNVETVDLVGSTDLNEIGRAIQTCIARNPGPAEPFDPERAVGPLEGYILERMAPDPAGYFVIYVDHKRGSLSLEHYHTNGTLGAIIDGRTAAELYVPAIERALLSRLDHAAYLGQELARAQRALQSNAPYVQDAAPELDTSGRCSCGSTCGGDS